VQAPVVYYTDSCGTGGFPTQFTNCRLDLIYSYGVTSLTNRLSVDSLTYSLDGRLQRVTIYSFNLNRRVRVIDYQYGDSCSTIQTTYGNYTSTGILPLKEHITLTYNNKQLTYAKVNRTDTFFNATSLNFYAHYGYRNSSLAGFTINTGLSFQDRGDYLMSSDGNIAEEITAVNSSNPLGIIHTNKFTYATDIINPLQHLPYSINFEAPFFKLYHTNNNAFNTITSFANDIVHLNFANPQGYLDSIYSEKYGQPYARSFKYNCP
jgi:hypothetical protein